jgi:hypothetical protein
MQIHFGGPHHPMRSPAQLTCIALLGKQSAEQQQNEGNDPMEDEQPKDHERYFGEQWAYAKDRITCVDAYFPCTNLFFLASAVAECNSHDYAKLFHHICVAFCIVDDPAAMAD